MDELKIRKPLDYDNILNDLVVIFNAIINREYIVVPEDLVNLKNTLNKIFNDSTCDEVIFTKNVDKMFFGLKVMPRIDLDEVYDILTSEDNYRISQYKVEIDSKLLDPVVALSAHQLAALLLYEVDNLIGDSTPMTEARNALNAYLATNRTSFRFSSSMYYKDILSFGLKDYLSKCRSIFYTSDISDIYTNDMAETFSYADALVDGFKNITSGNMKIYENRNVSKFTTFAWALGVYNNVRVRRIGVIHVLERAKLLTGSRYERLEMDHIIKCVKRIDDDMLLESSIGNKIRERLRKARLNNIKTIDNTFYELNMQVRNVEDENDALYLMRQINNSISILEDYKNSPDCDEFEKTNIDRVISKFDQLRERLSSTVVYKNKNYGLFLAYPDIVEDRY